MAARGAMLAVAGLVVAATGSEGEGTASVAMLEGLFNSTANHSGPLTKAEMGAQIDEAVARLPPSVAPKELMRRNRPTQRDDMSTRLADRLRGAKPSAGCGGSGPVPSTGRYSMRVEDPLLGWIDRPYEIHVPASYNHSVPTPLVLDMHAWGWDATSQRETNGMDSMSENYTYIMVYPEGEDDSFPVGWGATSWNAVGTTTWRDSALGPTCQWYPDSAEYPCHRSCQVKYGCDDPSEYGGSGCDCSSCTDDAAYILAVLEHLESELCVDRRRIHATGMSNGALMAYEAATGSNHALSRKIASIAPAAGAPLMGFNDGPHPDGATALLDMRGLIDNTVPANISNGWPAPWLPGEAGPHNTATSSDGFYYTPIDNITDRWAATLGCEGGIEHYPTRFDGLADFYCVRPHGRCQRPGDGANAEVVRCYHNGGHSWPWTIQMWFGEFFFAEFIFDFFDRHPQPM
jgi:poly(3-hydroxybutyrate) depolymerase